MQAFDQRGVRVNLERIRSAHVEPQNRRMTMDEKRITRLVGLSLGGVFAISLILSAISL
jgi:predicted alpha/beta superfamily hydrolase